MKLKPHEFEELQKHWYKILSDTGFKDIEKDERNLLQSGSFGHYLDPFIKEQKAQYYRCLLHRIEDENTAYKNDTDRYIMLRHSEGIKILMIVEELLIMGTPKHRHTVRCIIRRYINSWGIKYFTNEQLNVYSSLRKNKE